ncbi:hypothetical protein ILUMI_17861 [Ignelater luminosus]|uniref:Pacifastin domain-containing protein n=1 Tax=Ignelater luminosus TaxID=2038154 RepID=A0A8K0G4P1_IGNLU|nr:hypothetical protein ILUMI_17861 [Ignelater luminosus]
MKAIFLLEIFFLGVIIYVGASENFKCVDGVNYEENKCNGCLCDKGNLLCTLMACESHLNEKLTKCQVGTTWTEGCEQCWCVDKMGTICTLDCGEIHRRKSI